MLGFFLFVENSNKIKLSMISYESFRKIKNLKDNINTLFIFNDPKIQIIINAHKTIFTLGTLIYKNKWGREALLAISNDLNHGIMLNDILENTKGQYCLLIHEEDDLRIITDKLGSFPIFRYTKGDSIQISNIFPLLCKNNSLTLNIRIYLKYVVCLRHNKIKDT